jgi:hypothetical protein
MLALGADWCNSARGFMFALGCIQSLSCHTDHCPSGVATQDALRQKALVVPDKAERVRRFHASTMEALADFIAAAGVAHPSEIMRCQIMKRFGEGQVKSFAEAYPELAPGALLNGQVDEGYARNWAMAQAESFRMRA